MSKYLIVEDDDNKANVICNELLELGISYDSITRVDALKPALVEIKKNKFNLVLLDLNLPTFSKQTPVRDGGLIFIDKIISDDNKYIKPNHIIGLTSYEDIKNEQEHRFDELDFSLKSFDKSSWKTTLKNKVLWDIDSNRIKVRTDEANLVISVHGIRTLGQWQNNLESELKKQSSEIKFKKYRYNYYSAMQLLFPSSRERVICNFKNKLVEIINNHPNSKVTFIAHSFGTYILIKALELLPIDTDLKIENIILVSSVLKSNYNWSVINNKTPIKQVTNECGYNDKVLLLSHYFSYDMGMAGRTGFMGMDIHNRFYKGGHDFFTREDDFMEKYCNRSPVVGCI